MRSPSIPLLLTLSQVLLAAALPQRFSGRFWGNWQNWGPASDPSSTIISDTIDSSSSSTSNTESSISSILTTVAAASDPTVSQAGDANPQAQETTDPTTSSAFQSTVTFVNPSLSIETVTLTSLPETQTPTDTSAVQNSPTNSGTVQTSLQTSGRPASQPFPTITPTVTEVTLSPIPVSSTSSVSLSAPEITGTLTVPVGTSVTTLINSTVISVPQPTVISVTSVTLVNSSSISDGTTIQVSTVVPTVVTTSATVLSATTVAVSSVLTETLTSVLSSGPIPTSTPSSSCVFSISCQSQNIFNAVDINAPPSNIPDVGNHPVPRLNIEGMTGPIETNKFYANFFLGTQGSAAFVMPYSLTWSKGSGNAQSWGMAISQIDNSQKVFGPPDTEIPGQPNSFYINPLGIQSIILSAAELQESTVLTSDSLEIFSANINLLPNSGSSSSITFPILQGMGFITAVYTDLQPEIQSSVFFSSITAAGNPKNGVYKYRVVLNDGTTWLLYATPSQGVPPNFKLVSSTLLQGVQSWSGIIQVAKVPQTSAESLYDTACGAYPTAGSISGYANNDTAEYSISWSKAGPYADNTTLLMYALPHHVESFTNQTSEHLTSLQLQTTTKGIATAVVADYWVLTEQLPTSMGFDPWRPDYQSSTTLSATAIAAIQKVSALEASQNMSAQTNLNSMYYSGKGLSKFAAITYTMSELSGQKELANAALVELKQAFSVFTNNSQEFPLYYDTDWKGVVSSASYITGQAGADFGNSYYNDHHFHYGYFIHAASIIAYLDPTWLEENKDYVNALVRDVSNPSSLDTFFPLFRMFDWYHGHSWAEGLFESGDGKNEESSSEDTMFAYALKMWGKVTGDASMEARGNLMLAVLARSLQNYFLMDSNNKNQPAQFIGNRVTGILFENKVDHTTYFGNNLEYIQGIHMIPLLPFSTLTRTQTFVQEEWVEYFADGAVDPVSNISSGWKGILYANLAIINPQAAFNFFSQDNFDPSWLDGGASQTWYLAYSAGLGGSS